MPEEILPRALPVEFSAELPDCSWGTVCLRARAAPRAPPKAEVLSKPKPGRNARATERPMELATVSASDSDSDSV